MAKKRTKAQRAAAAKASWERRRKGLPPLTPPKKKRRGKKRALTVAPVDLNAGEGGFIINADPGYAHLANELLAAYTQSAHGKGKTRHANGKPFDRQPIMEIGRMVGPGYNAGQAAKKAQEALSMLERKLWKPEQAIAEIHGAIVYLAATAALIREGVQ